MRANTKKQRPTRFSAIAKGDRQNLYSMSSKEAAQCVRDVFGKRCSAQWLKSLPDSDAPYYRWRRGDKLYLRSSLDKWARNRSSDAWEPEPDVGLPLVMQLLMQP